MKLLLLYKPVGFTPLQAIQALRDKNPVYTHARLGAAGRLDPMAEGLLLVLVDAENKHQQAYLDLDKTYEVELVLGLTTDSYDLLGMPALHTFYAPSLETVQSTLQSLQGKILQPYPPYSAVRVKGKPLYWWARQQRLSEIDIPKESRDIYAINFLEYGGIYGDKLLELVRKRIELITGDFRQQEIVEAWSQLLSTQKFTEFPRLRITVNCSSGTYVRSIVHSLGQLLGTGATTTQIIRTRIGSYSANDAIRL